MNGALAIFVKTAGHSPVKSRLAAMHGAAFAEDFHALAARAVASVALRAQAALGITAYWAVAESTALDRWPGLPVIAQAQGGLGERMARVQAQLVARHGFGMLIGADAPQLSVGLLKQAHGWLAAPPSRLALGPAADGGFWLFGANLAPPLACWTHVEYSSADTARDFTASMKDLGQWHTLPTLTDADRSQDLPIVLKELQALPETTDEQRALAKWLGQHAAVQSDEDQRDPSDTALIPAQAGNRGVDHSAAKPVSPRLSSGSRVLSLPNDGDDEPEASATSTQQRIRT